MQRGNYIDFEEQKERKILKLQGYAQDFESAGVYGIYIDDILVYIGKSRDMLSRLA